MAKICPITKKYALYLDCLECEEKQCKNIQKKKIVIGIDQSYKNTGVSICINGDLKQITSIPLGSLRMNTEKRKLICHKLNKLFYKVSSMGQIEPLEVMVIIERIRLTSDGFLNIDYIKSIGALNALIVDTASQYNFKVYSVDTRSWKSNIVGTSKPMNNKYGIDPKKWPTIKYLINKGHEESILLKVSNKKKKGTVKIIDGEKYTYNDDAADSACIALYGFLPESKQNLQEEH